MQSIRIRFVDGCNTEPFLRLLSLSHIDTHNYEEIWAGLMRLRWCLVLALSFLLMTSTTLADDRILLKELLLIGFNWTEGLFPVEFIKIMVVLHLQTF